MIDTVVIPAAGLGTRLFTITKELPKEMVPIFYRTSNDMVLVKPLLEIIFENLFDSGFRNPPVQRIDDLSILPSPYLTNLAWDLVEKVDGVQWISSWETIFFGRHKQKYKFYPEHLQENLITNSL